VRIAEHFCGEGRKGRRVEDGEPLDDARVTRGRRPGDHAAPVVPDDRRPFPTQRPDEGGHVARERLRVVRPASLRLAVAAQVGRDGAVSGGRQRGQLVAPGARQLREAVQQEDERAVVGPGGGCLEADAVGVDGQSFDRDLSSRDG
jgi:hypothetical protein